MSRLNGATEYDILTRSGKPHPLAGVPQATLTQIVDELYDYIDDELNIEVRREDLIPIAHAMLSSVLQAFDFQAMRDEAYENGVEHMKQIAEAIIGQSLPKPQGELF